MKNYKLALVVMLFLIFSVPTYIGMARSDLSMPSKDWHGALAWIKENTPQGAVVVAWWDYGYWIEYLAEREAYLTPGQNYKRNTEIAKAFMSYDNSSPMPLGEYYLIIDPATAHSPQKGIAVWADLDYRTVNYEKTFVARLYEGEDFAGYTLVYDRGDVRIWEVRR